MIKTVKTVKTVKVTTKVIGPKAYRELVAIASNANHPATTTKECIDAMSQLQLTYSNLDSADWDIWKFLGLNVMQITKLEDKIQDLADDTWLVVTVTN